MDRKNFVIGLMMILGAVGLIIWQSRQATPSSFPSIQESELATVAQAPTSENLSPFVAVTPPDEGIKQTLDPLEAAESLTQLENDCIRVIFSTHGGAIKNIELKKHPQSLEQPQPFTFNAYADTPALAISLNTANGSPQRYAPTYELIENSGKRVLFKLATPQGMVIYRGYTLPASADAKEDPYLIKHELRFKNLTDKAFEIKNLFISLGNLPSTPADPKGEYLNFGHYNNKTANFVGLNYFLGSKGFLGIGSRKNNTELLENVTPVVWAAIKNQFFTAVLTPSTPGTGIWIQPMSLAANLPASSSFSGSALTQDQGITGAIKFNLGQLLPNQEKVLGMDYYVGPKEYTRLDQMGQNQDLVMQFGFFGFISKLLLTLMLGLHKVVPNWGVTIILLTVLVKLLLWPLTTAQVRSSKRMAKIQEPLQALKAKYKDNPQKLQTETMKLFKDYKVNPAAGCLPLLVQMPIFLGLYFMLRTCSELRFAHFLWIKDLSVADTITHIQKFPLNLLPLIMGVTMFWQMRIMPSPMTDNIQRKVFQFMPFMFLFICYNFPAGLVLYWTVQNLLTILQQAITSRMKDPTEDPSSTSVAHKRSKKTKAVL